MISSASMSPGQTTQDRIPDFVSVRREKFHGVTFAVEQILLKNENELKTKNENELKTEKKQIGMIVDLSSSSYLL